MLVGGGVLTWVEWPKWPQTPFLYVSGLNEESVCEPPLVFRMFPLEFSCLQHRFVVLKLKLKKKKEEQPLLPIILHSTVCVGGAAGAESSSRGIKANHLIERSEISRGFK